MAAMSTYLEQSLLTLLFRTSTFSKPSVIAICLCTTTPSASDSGSTIVEVANANGYARQTINPLDANWSAIVGGATSNSAAIIFPQASGSWGTITGIAICDSATYGAGNMLFFGALSVSKQINTQDTFTFTTNQLTIQLS